MVKAMQSVFDGDRDYVEWGELNDPLQMELERIAQLKMLPTAQEVEEQQVEELED
jgi:hypothetical protein